jgi:hypothetical protein
MESVVCLNWTGIFMPATAGIRAVLNAAAAALTGLQLARRHGRIRNLVPLCPGVQIFQPEINEREHEMTITRA